MKKIMIIAAMLLAAVAASAQSANALYNKYAGKAGVESAYISPAMFDMWASKLPYMYSFNFAAIEFQKFDGLYVLRSGETYSAALEKDADSMIQSRKFETLFEAAHDGFIRLYAIRNGDIVTDLVITSRNGDTDFSIIMLCGEISASSIPNFLKRSFLISL